MNHTKRLILIVAAIYLGSGGNLAAGQLPSTDVYMVGLADGKVDTVATPLTNLSDRDGYDNQPVFSHDGNVVVYVSDESGYSIDIWRYLIKRSQKMKLSYSDDINEYSPIPRPDRGYWAVLEEPGNVVRLWFLVGDGLSGDPVLPDLKTVGYFAWIDETRVALFIVGSEPTLQIADITTGKRQIVARSIGRSLHRIPGSTDISFVQKGDGADWMVKKYSPDTGEITEIAPVLGAGEDTAWTSDGTLMMASDDSIYRWDTGAREWKLFHQFDGQEFGRISRLAFSPTADKMAFVAERLPQDGTN